MAFDYSKPVDPKAKTDTADVAAWLMRETKELHQYGSPEQWPAQYLLYRHDRAVEAGGKMPTAKEAAMIQDSIGRTMADISADFKRLDGRADDPRYAKAGFDPEDLRRIAKRSYDAKTVGLNGPSPEGAALKDMPLYEAVRTYDAKYPGVIKDETKQALPGYSEYAGVEAAKAAKESAAAKPVGQVQRPARQDRVIASRLEAIEQSEPDKSDGAEFGE